MSSLSAIIVTHRAGPLLEDCLKALLSQLRHGDEWMVVVSAEPGIADLSGVDPEHCVLLPDNPGFAAAANAGIHRAKGELLLLLNDDTRAHPGFVDSLRSAAGVPGLYQPRILLAKEEGRLDNTGHGLFPDGFNWGRGREDLDGARYDVEREVGAVSGAAMLVHRKVLDTVGVFDEDLEAFGEDVDLSLRARRAGFPLRYVPEARISHVLGASYGRYGRRKIYLVERNRVRVAVRSLPMTALMTMPAWTGFRLAGLALAASLGRGWGARVTPGSGSAALAGIAAGLTRVPEALAKRRADAQGWVLGERAMWSHVLENRVRLEDVLR